MKHLAKALIAQYDRDCVPVYLMVRNKEGWHFPGGKIEETDLSDTAAIVREIKEELSFDVGLCIHMGNLYSTRGDEEFVVHWFIVDTPDDEDEIVANNEILEWKWVRYDQVFDVMIPELVQHFPNFFRAWLKITSVFDRV